jgi:hypothetical protein
MIGGDEARNVAKPMPWKQRPFGYHFDHPLMILGMLYGITFSILHNTYIYIEIYIYIHIFTYTQIGYRWYMTSISHWYPFMIMSGKVLQHASTSLTQGATDVRHHLFQVFANHLPGALRLSWGIPSWWVSWMRKWPWMYHGYPLVNCHITMENHHV